MMPSAGMIVQGAPGWVWVLLMALVALGVRRLRTRETPQAVAMIAPVAFLVWSIVGAIGFAGAAPPIFAATALIGGAAIGAASGVLLPDRHATRLPGGRVRQPGSPVPLILYVSVFVVRFACGAWAVIEPDQATMATAIGVAVSSATSARLIVGVLRWRALA